MEVALAYIRFLGAGLLKWPSLLPSSLANTSHNTAPNTATVALTCCGNFGISLNGT
jgi:hypothetical protein